MTPDDNLPLTIIGGYLGAGKTTLVNHLLRHADGLRLAVLVNEFGALPIDEDLIEAQDDDIIAIAGGCVCCSYGNDLTLALMKMAAMDPAPDHVLLEASGVAIPGAIAASVSLLQGYRLDGIVVLTNAETIREQAEDTYVGDTITRQLADADLVILNKTDLVEEAERAGTAAWLARQAPGAELVAAQHGALPRDVLLQGYQADRTGVFTASHPAGAGFKSLAIEVPHPVDPDALARALASPELGLIRAKGFVEAPSGIVSLQTVGRRWDIAPAAPSSPIGLVVIGLAERLDAEAVTAAITSAVTSARPTTPATGSAHPQP